MAHQLRPVPPMFMPQDYDNRLIGNFMKKKYPALCNLIKKPETCCWVYPVDAFAYMLEGMKGAGALGVRIYFANYINLSRPDPNYDDGRLNEGWTTPLIGTLTLIYAATDNWQGSKINDLGFYAMITPAGDVLKISPKAVTDMQRDYNATKKQIMESVVKAAGRPEINETISLTIRLDTLRNNDGFLGEVLYQKCNAVGVYLGSYNKDDCYMQRSDKPVGWQMAVVFEMVKQCTQGSDNYKYVVDIEDTPDYYLRPGHYPKPSAGPIFLLGGGDTLNPCPPATTNCT